MQGSILDSRRSSIDILHDILTVCDNGGVNKTAVMYKSNLSYDQLRRYLSQLSDRHLILRNESGHFQTTREGRETLKKVSRVRRSIRDLRRDLDADDGAAAAAD